MSNTIACLVAISRRIRNSLERQVKSQGSGIWRTTDEGNRIFIDNAGEVRAGGPAGPVLKQAPKRKLAKPREPKTPKQPKVPTAPPVKNPPVEKPPKAPKPVKEKVTKPYEPKTVVDKAIAEYIDSTDREMIQAFKGFVDEAHAMLGEKRNNDRASLREVLAAFGMSGSQASGWVGALRFKDDYTEIEGFDEMAEYAAKYHPDLLSFDPGESSGSQDLEQAFFRRLQQGFPYAPGKDSQEVLDQAAEMAGPSFFADATLAEYENASGEMDTWDKEELAELEESPF